MSTKLSFRVRRKKPELIAPAKQTPLEIKQVSDLDDQAAFRLHFRVILFYRDVNLSMQGQDPVTLLRAALGRVLEYYYPLAGRLINGEDNKLILDCNEEGVLFIEADADVTLEQLGGDAIQWPCSYMEEFLHNVPSAGGIIGCPLLLIQITRLLCGGVVIALRLNHVLGDGVSLLQFMHGFAEIARGNSEPSILPIWKREILNARSKPCITGKHPEYTGVSDNLKVLAVEQRDLVKRSFFFGPKEIRCIRKHFPDTEFFSKFEMITACIWKSRAIALQNGSDPNNQVVILTNIATIRGKDLLRPPKGYYGNTAITTGIVANVGALCNNPLTYTVGELRRAKAQVNKDFIQSTLDLMVIKKRPEFTPSNFTVADTSKFGFQEVDFGWGRAVCGGSSVEPSTILSVHMRCRNRSGEDGIVVPVCLPIDKMERFSVEIGKMTQDGEDLYDVGSKKFSSRL